MAKRSSTTPKKDAAPSVSPNQKPGAVTLGALVRKSPKARADAPTAKELSALAKKATRARWAARMDAEGR
jgi:hypothetical protein